MRTSTGLGGAEVRAFVKYALSVCVLLIAQNAFALRFADYIPPPFYYRMFCSFTTIMPFALLLWLVPLSLLKSFSRRKLILISSPFVIVGIALGVFYHLAWGGFEISAFMGPVVILSFSLFTYFIMKDPVNPKKIKTMFTIILIFLIFAAIMYASVDGMNDEMENPALYASQVIPLIVPASIMFLSRWKWWKRMVAAAVFLIIFYIPIYSLYGHIDILFRSFYISMRTVQDIGKSIGLPTTW